MVSEVTIVVEDKNTNEQESTEVPESANGTTRWSKPKVRNTLGGKNPQYQTKGRGITKPG